MREIKFRIIHENKIVGYEHLTETGWKWNWIELNPDNGERWSKGVIEDSHQPAMIRNQFTGCKADNGKEIYENDIILLPADQRCVIKYKETYLIAIAINPSKNYPKDYIYWSAKEVIGNIYENPELL